MCKKHTPLSRPCWQDRKSCRLFEARCSFLSSQGAKTSKYETPKLEFQSSKDAKSPTWSDPWKTLKNFTTWLSISPPIKCHTEALQVALQGHPRGGALVQDIILMAWQQRNLIFGRLLLGKNVERTWEKPWKTMGEASPDVFFLPTRRFFDVLFRSSVVLKVGL